MADTRKVAMALAAPRTIVYLDETSEDRALQPQEVRINSLFRD